MVVGFIVAYVVMTLLDLLWLGVVAKDFYRSQLPKLFFGQIKWPVVFLFYFVYVVGLYVFVVGSADGWGLVMGRGFLFGIVAYSVYELTNLATIDVWPVRVVVVDTIWGGFLSAIVSLSGYFVAKF